MGIWSLFRKKELLKPGQALLRFEGPSQAILQLLIKERARNSKGIIEGSLTFYEVVAKDTQKGRHYAYLRENEEEDEEDVIYVQFPFFDDLLPRKSPKHVPEGETTMLIQWESWRKRELEHLVRSYSHLQDNNALVQNALQFYYANHMLQKQGYDLFCFDYETSIKRRVDTSQL